MGQGLRPNGNAGQFQIRVTTSFAGQVATSQHLADERGAGRGRCFIETILILVIGGAAAAGAAVALGKGKSSTGTTTPPPSGVVITPGTPVITGPK